MVARCETAALTVTCYVGNERAASCGNAWLIGMKNYVSGDQRVQP